MTPAAPDAEAHARADATPAPDGSETAEPSPSPSDDPITAGFLPGSTRAPARAAPAPTATEAGRRQRERRVGRRGTAPARGGTSLFATLTRALPATVVATGGVTMAMAFLVFGKKRARPGAHRA